MTLSGTASDRFSEDRLNPFVPELELESGGRSFSFSFTLHRVAERGSARIVSPPAGAFIRDDFLVETGTVPLGSPATIGVTPDSFAPLIRSFSPGDGSVTSEDTAALAGFTSEPARVRLEGLDGSPVPGGGLVVRGWVSAREAITLVADRFAVADGGLLEATEVDVAEGSFDATLSMTGSASGIAFQRLDFDTDGDRQIDIPNSANADAEARYEEARPFTARVLAMLSSGVKLSAATQVTAYLPTQELRRFANGNPVDLALGPDGLLYVLDAAAGHVSRYGAEGNLVDLPVSSPVPVVAALKDRMIAGDLEGALDLVHPQQRALFRRIYEDRGPELASDAAAMHDFSIDRLRERRAIVRIHHTLEIGGSLVERVAPVHLVRAEDGTWQIFDY